MVINKTMLRQDNEELEGKLRRLQDVRHDHIVELYYERAENDDMIEYHADAILRLTEQIVKLKREIKHNNTFIGEA